MKNKDPAIWRTHFLIALWPFLNLNSSLAFTFKLNPYDGPLLTAVNTLVFRSAHQSTAQVLKATVADLRCGLTVLNRKTLFLNITGLCRVI